MKQKNLDELRNIYLGLVTGGEGPEVLSEYNVEAEKRTIQRRDQALGFIGNQSRRLANATIDSFKTDTNATKGQDTFKSPKPNISAERPKSKFAGARDAAFEKAKQIKGSPVVGPKLSNNTGNNGGLGSGGETTTPTASRPAATTAPKPAASPTKPMGGAPMDQWARANPTLAAKVKPGQSGYDTIKTRLSADNDRGPSTSTPNPVKANVPGFALGGKHLLTNFLCLKHSETFQILIMKSMKQRKNLTK